MNTEWACRLPFFFFLQRGWKTRFWDDRPLLLWSRIGLWVRISDEVCRSVAATISRPPRLVGRKDYARTIGPGLALPFLIIFSFLTVSARWDRDFIAMKDLFKFVIREMKGTWNDLPFFFSHWIVEIFTLIWRIPRKLETRLNNAVYCTENLTTRISH